MNTQGSKTTLLIQRAVENYELILELIKLPVKSEVGGANKILMLNLKQLFVCNIFDNHILIFDFNFQTFREIILYIEDCSHFLASRVSK